MTKKSGANVVIDTRGLILDILDLPVKAGEHVAFYSINAIPRFKETTSNNAQEYSYSDRQRFTGYHKARCPYDGERSPGSGIDCLANTMARERRPMGIFLGRFGDIVGILQGKHYLVSACPVLNSYTKRASI